LLGAFWQRSDHNYMYVHVGLLPEISHVSAAYESLRGPTLNK